MGLSDPIQQSSFIKAPSAARNQSGSQSPSSTGHYANQIGVNTSPSAGSAARQRLTQAPSQKPGRARGKKPSRTAG